jgi:YegS/Rv2252/BmrU family lipid kinase
MTAFVVVNPQSANGRTARDWPKIKKSLEEIFPRMSVAHSRARGDVTRLVRAALKEGHLNIIAVGGDGTINEAINGFFEHGMALSPDAVFGFVSSGRGSDFRRTFGIKPGYEAGIARLKQSRIRRVDIGCVACLSQKGEPVSRYFVNVASFGLSGKVVARVGGAGLTRLLGDGFTYVFHALAALIGWRPQRVRLIANSNYDEIAGIANVAVANGRWFSGGLRVAPQAEPGDGVFDIVVMGGKPRRRIVQTLQSLRTGAHLDDPAVRVVRASRLVAAPTVETNGAVAVETDGESAGLLPATFEILPSAINLRC